MEKKLTNKNKQNNIYNQLIFISFLLLFIATLITIIALYKLNANKKTFTIFEIKYQKQIPKK